MHTDKCGFHPSTNKLLFATDGDQLRKTQLIKMKVTSDYVVRTPNWYIYNTTPVSMFQNHCG